MLAARAPNESRQSEGGANMATRLSRDTIRHPPISRAEESDTPATHATTSQGRARSHATPTAGGQAAAADERAAAPPATKNVTGGAAAIADNAAQANA